MQRERTPQTPACLFASVPPWREKASTPTRCRAERWGVWDGETATLAPGLCHGPCSAGGEEVCSKAASRILQKFLLKQPFFSGCPQTAAYFPLSTQLLVRSSSPPATTPTWEPGSIPGLRMADRRPGPLPWEIRNGLSGRWCETGLNGGEGDGVSG